MLTLVTAFFSLSIATYKARLPSNSLTAGIIFSLKTVPSISSINASFSGGYYPIDILTMAALFMLFLFWSLLQFVNNNDAIIRKLIVIFSVSFPLFYRLIDLDFKLLL